MTYDIDFIINKSQPQPESAFVDLGLSVDWGKYNLGVDPNNLKRQSDWNGDYYAWGELETKYYRSWDETTSENRYTWDTYTRHTNGTYSDSNKKVFIKYIPTSKASTYWASEDPVDNKLTLDLVDDVANKNLGGNWRMPTEAEFNELLDPTKVTNEWVTNYKGINYLNGREFTSLINGNKLFIPAAGLYDNRTPYNNPYRCTTWSSTLRDSNPIYAQCFDFENNRIGMYYWSRYTGMPIRPVLQKN